MLFDNNLVIGWRRTGIRSYNLIDGRNKNEENLMGRFRDRLFQLLSKNRFCFSTNSAQWDPTHYCEQTLVGQSSLTTEKLIKV